MQDLYDFAEKVGKKWQILCNSIVGLKPFAYLCEQKFIILVIFLQKQTYFL